MEGWTALMKAAGVSASEACMMALIEGGADVNRQDEDGFTALMRAASRCDVCTVRLLKTNPLINIQARFCQTSAGPGPTALMICVLCRSTEVVEQMLRRGANPDLQCNAGWTALMLAASKDDLETLRLLLRWGASRTLINKDGQTARAMAARRSHGRCERELARWAGGPPRGE